MLMYSHYRRRGIEARRKYVTPVGAWFSQLGRLHQVHHMWQYRYVICRFNFLLLTSAYLKEPGMEERNA